VEAGPSGDRYDVLEPLFSTSAIPTDLKHRSNEIASRLAYLLSHACALCLGRDGKGTRGLRAPRACCPFRIACQIQRPVAHPIYVLQDIVDVGTSTLTNPSENAPWQDITWQVICRASLAR
jgi:hypothetical protein